MRFIAALLAILIFAGCGSQRASNHAIDESRPSPRSAKPRDALPPPPSKPPFVNGSNAFAADLWAVLRNTPGNLAVSPASITIALAMTFNGARGETAEEIKRVLHFHDPEQAVHSAGETIQGWNVSNGLIVLRSTNVFFGQYDYTFEKRFLDTTEHTFGAPLELMDFKNEPEKARQRINIWGAKATNYRFSEFIPAGNIDSNTRLVLVNAIYFKARWRSQFDETKTKHLPFHLTTSQKKDVPMMVQSSDFLFAQRQGARAIEMLYEDPNTSMLFILPDSNDGLSTLEQSLTSDELDRWAEAMAPRFSRVILPKFGIGSQSPLMLRDKLQQLGMRVAFDRNTADFAGMAKPKDLTERVHIGNIFHNAFVKVDEEGTEAAAIGGTSLNAYGGGDDEFKADHPFMFVLRDRKTGMILFMGRVADPSTG